MKNNQIFSVRRRSLLKGLGALPILLGASRSEAMSMVAPEWQGVVFYSDFTTSDQSAQNAALAAKFVQALPIPPELAPTSSDATTDYYSMYQIESIQELIPGFNTRVWTYNGMTPGPTIRVQQGRTAEVLQYNLLPEAMSTHLHGGHIEPNSDGHPNDLIAPYGSKTYTYSNIQEATTLWYHDHAVDVTAPHVYKGLAGMYIIEDANEQALRTANSIPGLAQEVPIIIQDRSFNGDGSFAYAGNSGGELGDTIIVNGKVQPHFKVANRKYRFRVLNGSNRRDYRLALDNGDNITQIGTDGGLLEAPLTLTDVFLPPAYRTDIVIDFSSVAIGSSVILQNILGSGSTAEIMRFDVDRSESDPVTLPATLNTITPIDPGTAAATRHFIFRRTNTGSGPKWTINGLPYDPVRIDAQPQLGTTEIWELENQQPVNHPVHIHDIQWQVLDIDGVAPGPDHQGWKDTFHLPGFSTVRVIGRFTTYTGVYVMHCHNLEHEDDAMMMNFEVIP